MDAVPSDRDPDASVQRRSAHVRQQGIVVVLTSPRYGEVCLCQPVAGIELSAAPGNPMYTVQP